MVDIEPYQYQKTTNIKEHNDIVAKINEIVDVINNANLDTVISKISELDTEIEGITENLVSDVSIIDGITTGKFKVRLDRKKAPSIDSNDYNLQKATSIELIQGSGPAMVKAQITLSDGTVLISDDFMFTTEAIGQDVYISSFVFKNGNVAGTISADIGLSNGTTLEANNFLVPTDPSVISNITDLQNRVTNIENTSVTDSRIDAIENELNNKADITNVDQEITFKTATVKSAVQFDGATGGVPSSTEYGIVGGNDEKHPFTVTMKTEAFDQVVRKPIGELALLDGSGNPKNFTVGVKTLYTGPITDLINVTSSNIIIEKDFDIEYFNYSYGTYKSTRVTVSKINIGRQSSTKANLIGVAPSLTDSISSSNTNTFCRISITGTELVVYLAVGSKQYRGTQYTVDTFNINSDYYGYRLFV